MELQPQMNHVPITLQSWDDDQFENFDLNFLLNWLCKSLKKCRNIFIEMYPKIIEVHYKCIYIDIFIFRYTYYSFFRTQNKKKRALTILET